ncbi:MAG TPA: glycosyl hydrolase family protein [Candidatus Sulfotelmatobacter sp.]|nr:glycosyl hydrolase family protein [Candidatus Sulfotelmatobacter sp.]
MKTTRNLLLAGMILLFCFSIGNAQIVYSNNFALGGATNIWGAAPTVANSYAGGASSATWNDALGTNDTGDLLANGSDTSALGDSWLLPFNPQPGYVYTLTASLTFTGNPGNWVGLGFAQNDSVNVPNGYGRFSDSGNGGPTGYDFIILTESSGGVQYFTGPKGNTPQIFAGTGFTSGPQTLTVQVILNTTNTLWSISAYVNGVQMGYTTNYASYPPIGAVGITQTSLTSPTAVRWNNLTLQAVGPGPTSNTVNATVSFSPANTGVPLNPAFNGLSYEKVEIANGFFTSNNVPLVKLFSMIGPAVLRVGGGTVDTTCWGGLSNTVPITAAEVDTFAGFIKALPTNWSVIYGINLLSNTPANGAAEAAYAANALGPRLLGFEIGNEPEYGFSQYSSFLASWRSVAAAITNAVPGWAVTNGGNGWTLVGADAGQGQLSAYTDPFASEESGVVSMLTQHFYVAAGGSTNDTMQLLLQPDSFLLTLVDNIVTAAAGNCPLGARISECGSYSAGGVVNVSDALGAALWSLDFMFTMAENGGQGVNFHGGGLSPYSPLIDNGTDVTTVGPEFYGLKMFSLLPPGNVIPANTLTLSTNFTAYGVRQANGAISALLNNKDANDTIAVSINLGPDVAGAQVIELTGPSLYSTDDFTLGGAAINPNGTWNGGVQEVLSATNGQLTVNVPPASAFLLNPVVPAPQIALSASGKQLTLDWPTNYAGWLLESNSIGLASTNWFPVPGSGNTNRVQITIQPGQGSVFYRLSVP